MATLSDAAPSVYENVDPSELPLAFHVPYTALMTAPSGRLKVYVTLGYRAPVSQLDADTGDILQTYPGTEGTGEIRYLDGTLILSLVEGGKGKVAAVDAASGRMRWKTEKSYLGSTTGWC